MKIWSNEVSRRPPAGATMLRASTRSEPAETGSRTITYCASDSSVGRDGHTIAADAWVTDNFERNPVFLWAHDADSPPIGRVTALRTIGDRLMATVEYASADEYEFADTIFRLAHGGYICAVSTGFLPLEWRAANDRSRPGGLDFKRVELIEISAVPIPALPTALVTARAAGIDVRPFAKWAERALDTGGAMFSRKELTMVRSAAGAAKLYAAPRLVEQAGPSAGFRSLGEFLQTVARASAAGAAPDTRLTRVAHGAGESDPASGGFLVPTVFVETLIESMYDEAVVAPLCSKFETDTPNDVRIPGVDEVSRADGSRWGGSTAYWSSEGDTVSASLPKFRGIVFSAHKLIALCVASGELISDARMLGEYIRRAFAAEMSFKLDTSIISGSGGGVPWGILNSPVLLTVAKESGQAAATITPTNIENMWASLPVPCRKRATWLCSEKVEAQLSAVASPGLSASQLALYMSAGVNGNEYALLKGRPLIPIEQATALGKVGDIILGDFTQYGIVDAGMKANLSMDVDFASDQGIFRFVWRVDAKPLWSSAITSYSDASLRSPFVVLAAR